MNQLEALTTLVDAARQMPETKHLNRAIKLIEQVITRRREKRERAARRKVAFSALLDEMVAHEKAMIRRN